MWDIRKRKTSLYEWDRGSISYWLLSLHFDLVLLLTIKTNKYYIKSDYHEASRTIKLLFDCQIVWNFFLYFILIRKPTIHFVIRVTIISLLSPLCHQHVITFQLFSVTEKTIILFVWFSRVKIFKNIPIFPNWKHFICPRLKSNDQTWQLTTYSRD